MDANLCFSAIPSIGAWPLQSVAYACLNHPTEPAGLMVNISLFDSELSVDMTSPHTTFRGKVESYLDRKVDFAVKWCGAMRSWVDSTNLQNIYIPERRPVEPNINFYIFSLTLFVIGNSVASTN